MIFINPLLQAVCFVMAVLHEVCVPTQFLQNSPIALVIAFQYL